MSHSSDIVDVLNDLMDKAQTQLDETRHAESNAARNFALLRLSPEDQLAQDNKALTKAKAVNSKFVSSPETERADLAEAERSLAAALAYEVASKDSCAQVAADHEVSAKAFTEEVRWTHPQDLDDKPIIENTQISYLLHANTDVLDGEVSRHQGSDLGRDRCGGEVGPAGTSPTTDCGAAHRRSCSAGDSPGAPLGVHVEQIVDAQPRQNRRRWRSLRVSLLIK